MLSRVAYPVMLLGIVATFVLTTRHGWDTGQITFIFQLALTAYLVALEYLIPHDRSWQPSRREWGLYGVYYVLTVIGGALGQALVLRLVGVIAPPHPALPLWGELPLALLLGSLAGYIVHRLGHTLPWLWRLHGVHHVPDKVNVGNNGVNHVADVFISQGFTQLALALIGFSERAVFGVGLFVVVQGYFVHANIRVRLGVLNHVFASPELHRLHHSTDLSEAGHFGTDLSIWDRAFSSFTWHPGREPVAVGLSDPGTFPGTGAIVATLIHPLRRTGRGGERAGENREPAG
ncbi:C4-dicarboxylate ABC transporter [Streptomyces tsukubensis]|uniref:C4-dicarboxylate ABC transporter n=1 Tax=Streptomyces tsukubensis TaxID=83656 RepID=A0A1V4A2H5_9ACTN|nr:C4-dicarboxylate ABC transporter [Streptomyces tsukubensis]